MISLCSFAVYVLPLVVEEPFARTIRDDVAQAHMVRQEIVFKQRLLRYTKQKAKQVLGFFTTINSLLTTNYSFATGSQVRLIPNFLNIFWSTSLNITVQCT